MSFTKMTPQEFEQKVLGAAFAASNLTAAIDMTNDHYFEETVEGMDGAGCWVSVHEQLSGVMGAILTLSIGLRDTLGELANAKVEPTV